MSRKLPNLKECRELRLCEATRTLWLVGDVGDSINFIETDSALSLLERKKTPIVVKLMSDGGCIFEAAAIAGRLLESPNHVEIQAYGMNASASLSLLAVGDVRKASRTSRFLHHDAATIVGGRVSTMANSIQGIQKAEKSRLKWLAEFTKKDADWWQRMAVPELFFGAEEALEWGLIDEIC